MLRKQRLNEQPKSDATGERNTSIDGANEKYRIVYDKKLKRLLIGIRKYGIIKGLMEGADDDVCVTYRYKELKGSTINITVGKDEIITTIDNSTLTKKQCNSIVENLPK